MDLLELVNLCEKADKHPEAFKYPHDLRLVRGVLRMLKEDNLCISAETEAALKIIADRTSS